MDALRPHSEHHSGDSVTCFMVPAIGAAEQRMVMRDGRKPSRRV
jgi:hypothetical protein